MIKNPLFAEQSFRLEKHTLIKILLFFALVLLLIGLKYFKWESADEKLYKAILQNDLVRAEELLRNAADPNAAVYKGSTLLHDAIVIENPQMIALLLKHGANPELRNRFFLSTYQWADYVLRDSPRKNEIIGILMKNQTSIKQNQVKISYPEIGDFIVCNAYWDYYQKTSLKNPYTAKFALLFYPNAPTQNSILDISIKGPDGYHFTIKHRQNINLQNLNGFTLQENGFLWYQGYDPRGFLKNGRYTLTIKYVNGTTRSSSRNFHYNPHLLKGYLAQKNQFKYSPQGVLKTDQIKDISWSTIKGFDAYYCLRLAPLGPDVHLTRNLTRNPIIFDNIFGQPGRGFNQGSFSLSSPLKLAAGKYVWMVEILDHNDLELVSIAIFQPLQWISVK